MPCRLICLRGALEGAVFELPSDGAGSCVWTVGRGSANQIELADLQASRNHAAFKSAQGGWEVEDLDSTNGTLVNGTCVGRQRLEGGDHIQIGDAVFLYLNQGPEGPGEVLVEARECSLATTIHASESGTWWKKAASVRDPRNHMGALLEVASAVKEWQSLEGLQRNLLKLVLKWVPAERGAVLALDPESGEVSATYFWRRSNGTGAIAVSRSILEQVRRNRTALLGHFGTDGRAPSESVLRAGIRSLIAAPMVVRDGVVGVLYLDTLDNADPLTEESLQFAAAAAAMAAQPLESARRIDQLEGDKRRLEADLGRGFDMIGDSPAMQQLYVALMRAAPSDATVLILGETGSGKEMVAGAIHARSRRSHGPFIPINCAAIAENLLESELFGHERGAFTGAIAQKRGKIELANGGTLFLDEIGELPFAMQAKLLRVLQEHELERVGGTRPIPINVRLVAATNRDLTAMIMEGRFRADLYYRLNVVSLRLPALRERPGDILPLSTYFLGRLGSATGRLVRGFSPGARKALTRYDWPGNVRELRNAIERALVLGNSEWIEPCDLPEEVIEVRLMAAEEQDTYQTLVLDAKRRILESTLAQAGGRYTEASRILGIHVKHLHRLMRNYGLKEQTGE